MLVFWDDCNRVFFYEKKVGLSLTLAYNCFARIELLQTQWGHQTLDKLPVSFKADFIVIYEILH